MAVTLGSKAVGSIVKLKEDGVFQDYIVVHHGKPNSSDYDIFPAYYMGTWVLRKDIHSKRIIDSHDKTFSVSELEDWLNAYSQKFESSIRSNALDTTHTPTFSRPFLLSPNEMGLSQNDFSTGAKLDYFDEGTSTIANNKRIAKYNNLNTSYWTRDGAFQKNHYITSTGTLSSDYPSSQQGIRPAFVLSDNLWVTNDGVITENLSPPNAPPSITVPNTIYGGNNINISWGASTDVDGSAAKEYRLEKSVNSGSSWSQIYQGSALSTTDHVSYGTTTVMYRVKAYDIYGLESGYKTSNNITVINNTAPTVPPSITVPNIVIGGKTLNISWSASTDAQGDTIKYQLERSINSGGSYTKIYDGSGLAFVDTIDISWTKVLYRVRAYDHLMTYSAYKTSTDKTVLNLTVSTINVPNVSMRGQAIPISWSNAISANNYTLERLVDSGNWQSIYTGANTSYTDTAGAWNTVQYRVKASNNGNFGDYKTSSAVPVVATSVLVISGEDSDLGTLVNDISYTVSTDTGNKISLERYVNNQLIAKISVNSGFNYTIPVIDLPTGTGTIKLVATVQTSTGSPVSKTRIWTYNKTPVVFANSGGVGALIQDGKNVFPPTLAECVRVSAQFGGSLDKALELIAPLLNIAVMAVGSYTGSGTFGKNSPNSLTFNFTPQMVIISGGNRSLTISNTIKTDGGTVGYIEGTKVTWYNNLGADEQLNQSETTYTYIAVGKQV